MECIPFSETRNYVMRVMEGMQVYRARLGAGSAPITLTSDLKRGSYGAYAGPAGAPARPASPGASSMAPIPNPYGPGMGASVGDQAVHEALEGDRQQFVGRSPNEVRAVDHQVHHAVA